MIEFKGWSINPKFFMSGTFRMAISIHPQRYRYIKYDGQIMWEVKG